MASNLVVDLPPAAFAAMFSTLSNIPGHRFAIYEARLEANKMLRHLEWALLTEGESEGKTRQVLPSRAEALLCSLNSIRKLKRTALFTSLFLHLLYYPLYFMSFTRDSATYRSFSRPLVHGQPIIVLAHTSRGNSTSSRILSNLVHRSG